MIDGKLLDFGYLTTKSQTIHTHGNVQFDRLVALLSIDAGIGVQRTFTIPDPTVQAALESVGMTTQAQRDAWLNMLADLDNLTPVLSHLEREWKMMQVTAPAIKIVPVSSFDYNAVGGKDDDKKIKCGENDLPAMVFMSQSFVESARALNEKREFACHVIARFVNSAFSSFANLTTIGFAPEEWTHPTRTTPTIVKPGTRNGTLPLKLLLDMIDQIYQTLEFQTYKERIAAPETTMVTAREFLMGLISMMKKNTADAFTLNDFQIMVILEAILELKPALSSKYHITFPIEGTSTSLTYDTLAQNFEAAERIYNLFNRRHMWTPLCNRYRVESVRDYWNFSFKPLIYQLDYQMGEVRIGGMKTELMIPAAYWTGQYRMQSNNKLDPAEAPVGQIFLDNKEGTWYRSTRDISQMVSTWDTCVDITGDDKASESFKEIQAIIIDRISSRDYLQKDLGCADGKNVVASVTEKLKALKSFNNSYSKKDVLAIPIAGSRIKNAGNIEAFGLTPGFSLDIKTSEDTIRSTNLAIPWVKRVWEQVEYSLKPTPGSLPSPFTAL